jgi:hypothetical protein
MARIAQWLSIASWSGKNDSASFVYSVALTSLTLSCTAKAHVPKVARRDGCDVRAAISGARK